MKAGDNSSPFPDPDGEVLPSHKGEPRFGPYRLLKKLGIGGMGEVALAEATEGRLAGTRVALKILRAQSSRDPECVRRFQDEALVIAQLQHPHIVDILDLGEIDGTTYLALEWVNGTSLDTILQRWRQRRTRVPFEIAVSIIQAISSALGAVHALGKRDGGGLMHGDVSPSNILVGRDGSLKLADFGTAELAQRANPDFFYTTASYCAPERFKGEPPTPAADVFSLGVLAFEMLTLRHPFSGKSREVTMANIVHRRAPSARDLRSDIPPELAKVIARAIAKTYKSPWWRPFQRSGVRYENGQAFAEALAPFAADPEAREDFLVELFYQNTSDTSAHQNTGS